jgi:quercetin dioxygenase-like cupin family protein
MIALRRAGLLFVLLAILALPIEAQGQGPEVKTLVTKDLAAAAGQETLVLMVEYGPGVSEPVHRHNAQAFVYVLEGSVVMQVKGQPPVTLKAGETFYEGRDDVHLVGRNASQTNRARFVVFLVKEKGAPVAVPAP